MCKSYYEKAISYDELYKALKKACRNVRWKDSVVVYEFNGLENTLLLAQRLKSGKYKISRYQIFQIREPKERTIVASRLVDRQFQRSLCDNGLYKDVVDHFIRDNSACQIGRGTDDTLNRTKEHMRRYYRKHGPDGWVLKCDIRHFFPETRHDVAKAAARKLISDPDAIKAVCDVIDSFDGDKGIGLGSQISQLIELSVLDDLDHYVKEQLHIKFYVRYMDDFVLVHPDREYLKYCREMIERRLEEIGLTLNKKTSIAPLHRGVSYLQWKFVLTDSGKVLMLMKPEKVRKFRRRLRKLWRKEVCGEVQPGTAKQSLTSFLANAKRGNTVKIQRQMITYFNELTGGSEHDEQRKVA